MNEFNRVHDDEIEYDDDLVLVGGTVFTGTIYCEYPDGQLKEESYFIEGLPSGIQRTWHSNGQLSEEWLAIRGHGCAWTREWHANGVMKYERINENNLAVHIREWAEDGTLLEESFPQQSR